MVNGFFCVKRRTLCYELGVSIWGGDLVWIQGPYPYPAGEYTDIKIFNKVFIRNPLFANRKL